MHQLSYLGGPTLYEKWPFHRHEITGPNLPVPVSPARRIRTAAAAPAWRWPRRRAGNPHGVLGESLRCYSTLFYTYIGSINMCN